MSTSRVIEDILRREGGFVNDKADKGKRTIWGISERAHPEAWKNGPPTKDEARAIYAQKYIKAPGFDKIPPSTLQEQLIDFGVNSGPRIAIQKLQVVVGANVDGVLGPKTLEALGQHDFRSVNNGLVGERLKMLGRIVSKDPSQLRFLNGWINRACEFLS